MTQHERDSLNTPTVPFIAALNPRWRQRAFVRSGLSLALALLFFMLYWQDNAMWQFALSTVFVIFTIVPLILVSACNPPLIVTDDKIILRAIRKRILPFDQIEQVIYEPESRLLGVKLSSGETVLIPWHLMEDPSSAHEKMCTLLRCG